MAELRSQRHGPGARVRAGLAFLPMASQIVRNIDDSAVQTRMRQAVLALGVTLAGLVALGASRAPVWVAAFLIIPFFGVMLLAMQSLFGTCVFLGATGMRDFGEGHEKIACAVTSGALRAQSRTIWLASVAGAFALTACALASLAIR